MVSARCASPTGGSCAFGRAEILRTRGRFTWHHAAAELARIYAAVLAPHRARLATVVSR
jgi:hypothetical protein